GKKDLCCAANGYCPGSETCCTDPQNPVCGHNNTNQENCCPTGASYCPADNSCCSKTQQCFTTPGGTAQCCSNGTAYCNNTGECCDAKGAGFFCNSDESHCCAPGHTGDYCAKLPGGASCCNEGEKCFDDKADSNQTCCTDKKWCTDKAICCTQDSTGRHLNDP